VGDWNEIDCGGEKKKPCSSLADIRALGHLVKWCEPCAGCHYRRKTGALLLAVFGCGIALHLRRQRTAAFFFARFPGEFPERCP